MIKIPTEKLMIYSWAPDEAPRAYKDIEEVIKNQLGLINVEERLSPIAVVKA